MTAATSVSPEAAARIAARLEPYLRQRDGAARQATWEAEDGWLIVYTTTRIEGGPHAGRFATMAYRPTGKGARTGNASEWARVYLRAFATRKAARARAEALYYRHSPKAAARHGKVTP